jgi:predicted nucleic acid-binding protein
MDTGPLVAFYNKRDGQHASARDSFARIARGETPYRKLYTSDYVLDESLTLCRSQTGNHKLAVELGTDIFSSKTMVLLKVDESTLKGSWELYKQRAEINLSFTDCSTAVLARTHGVSDIFTYDDDFNSLRFHGLKAV